MKKQIIQVELFKSGWVIHVCFFLLSLSIVNKTLAQQGPPFTCNTSVYLFQGNPTNMFGLDLNTGIAQSLASPLIANPPNQSLNAFGFNRVDNYIWGYRQNANEIIRVASDYSVTIFPIAGLPANTSFNVADINENGIMYLYFDNSLTLYRIDLNPIGNPQLILPNLAITPSHISDWAFSPVDGNIYAINNDTWHVYRFDTAGVRTDLGIANGGGIQEGTGFGATFMDSLGNMYSVCNSNGKIFKIALPNTGNITATLYSQGATSYQNDGAANIIIGSIPLITVSNDSAICNNTSIQLNATASSGNIEWQTDPTLSCTSCNDPIATPFTPTTYFLTATDNGCASIDSVSVSFYTSALLTVSSDTSLCEGASATLNSNSALQVNWTPANDLSCATCTTTFATPGQTTTYVATADMGSCLLSDSVTITVDTSTPILFLNETIICANDILQLNAVADADDINWFPADYLSCDTCFNPVCIPPADMTYLVTTQNVTCPDSALITIYALPLPIVDAGNDTTIVEGQSLNLNASGALNYQWNVNATLSDLTINNPLAAPTETTYYFVTGTDENGCTAVDSIAISLKSPCNSIYVPNTFTPNDDGLNDIFLPSISGFEIEYYELKIWDRWGTLIFESFSPENPWVGDVREGEYFAQDGTYAWQLSVQGECNPVTPEDFVGHVNLVR
jgi:gliding motility-associated-like protein